MTQQWKQRPAGSKQLAEHGAHVERGDMVRLNTGLDELIPGMRLDGRHPMLPLHEHCLFKNGIHLGELWRLSELARWLREHGRRRLAGDTCRHCLKGIA